MLEFHHFTKTTNCNRAPTTVLIYSLIFGYSVLSIMTSTVCFLAPNLRFFISDDYYFLVISSLYFSDVQLGTCEEFNWLSCWCPVGTHCVIHLITSLVIDHSHICPSADPVFETDVFADAYQLEQSINRVPSVKSIYLLLNYYCHYQPTSKMTLANSLRVLCEGNSQADDFMKSYEELKLRK